MQAHVFLAMGVVGVVALMVLPVPLVVLDTLIAFSIASSTLLMMLSLYISGPLALSTFPSLILLTTVLRLSLNIASTKQILLHARGGHVIETFGSLVMGGNVVVGLVVFSIIAIVQFIVISKGAERVAEVGARFTLDAMPGKQMSIDADLRAGIIDKDEACRQRQALARESQLHGAMDGAMKFVKGDAVAAIIIAVVNIVAGISIGIAMLGMTVGEAATRFTLLTVGDGMVSQIPSLLTSVAAGILITRVASDGAPRNLAAQISGQVMAQPAAIFASSAVLFAFVAVPGFPKLTFLVLGAAVAGLGIVAWRRARTRPNFDTAAKSLSAAAPGGALGAAVGSPEGVGVIVVPLRLRVDADQRQQLSPQALQERMEVQRQAIQRDLGLPFPTFQVRFDESLEVGCFEVDVQELPAFRGCLDAPEVASQAPEQVLAEAVGRVVRQRPDAFVGMQEIQRLIKRAQEELPDLSDEVQRAMPVQRVAEVLRRLALEGVSLRYLREAYESLLVWQGREKDVGMLTEYVRIELGRFITHPLLDAERRLHAVNVDADLESRLRESIQQGPAGAYLALPPETSGALLESADRVLGELPADRPSVVLTTVETRRFLRRLLAQRHPRLIVLSFQELPPDAQIVPVGRLSIGRAGAARPRVAALE